VRNCETHYGDLIHFEPFRYAIIRRVSCWLVRRVWSQLKASDRGHMSERLRRKGKP
jgi:hypothetical protein